MLRSLYAGVSGMMAQQQALDVTGTNIANSSTIGYKSTSVTFEDTLSQSDAGQGPISDTAPAGGVKVASTSTNLATGSAQQTGIATNVMIDGDGYFAVRSGSQTLFTRAGAFSFAQSGQLVDAAGNAVQGWTADASGAVDTGRTPGDLRVSPTTLSPAATTTSATLTGNLDSSTAEGMVLHRDLTAYAADGTSSTASVDLTRTATGWDVSDSSGALGSLAFTASGAATGTTSFTTVGGITLDLSGVTGYDSTTTASVASQNGRATGSLSGYRVDSDGDIVGTFSNGATTVLGRIAVATFGAPGGLTRQGESTFSASSASGAATFRTAGEGGSGSLLSGQVEGSNVDLSTEFAHLIVAQRGFQANARVVTTSDSILQEVNGLYQRS